jgi:hypothetical protein
MHHDAHLPRISGELRPGPPCRGEGLRRATQAAAANPADVSAAAGAEGGGPER